MSWRGKSRPKDSRFPSAKLGAGSELSRGPLRIRNVLIAALEALRHPKSFEFNKGEFSTGKSAVRVTDDRDSDFED